MITQDITRFEFDSQELRTVTVDGETLFCGKDVATILGYENPTKAVRDHCKKDGGLKRYPIQDSLGRTQEAAFITEPDLYRLITHSKLPTAEKFERWVFEDVLPTIRKTGMYATPAAARRFLQDPQALMYTLQALQEEKNKTKALEQKVEPDAPKVLFADAVATSKTSILIGDLAKILRSNGIQIGQNRLFEWLRDENYLCKTRGDRWNMPRQSAMEQGLFEVKQTVINNPDGTVRVTKTTKVTGKGQQYFVNKFCQMAEVRTHDCE
ncbi:phage antirepressor [Mobiluncus curtisii]|uniref:phage antirepressor n=1 Tax=Mobiluncus curtisii TaxID=2051 RepID=UPI00242FC2ED|nr:phage antirepressor [Mobiluncus curtisii]